MTGGLRRAALLLLGAFHCAAAAGIIDNDGVTPVATVASAAFNSTSWPDPDTRATGGVALAAATSSLHPDVYVESNTFSEGPLKFFRGRSLLHGCHGKRSASRFIFLKCGPAASEHVVLMHQR